LKTEFGMHGQAMKRREFMTLFGGATLAWPRMACAQQMPVIGLLGTTSREAETRLIPFRQALKEAGYVEGQNVAIEYRWAEEQYDRFPALATDLVRRQVTMIVSLGGTPGALAAKAATSTIPIVFQAGVDPVDAGIVASLNRPGGNITGVSQLLTATVPKQVQMMHEAVPTASTIGFLLNETNPLYSEAFLKDLEAAASTLGSTLHGVHASTETDFDLAFATLLRIGAGALVVGPDLFFLSRRERIVALAAHHLIPVIYPWREGATAGGLMSYASSQADTYRQVGIYAARILKGDKPADLPVQQSVKIELILNLKTARALGITFPLSLLGRADEVIE
jgi:putative tryptophan/tyrosine transport system substrate-binding protein